MNRYPSPVFRFFLPLSLSLSLILGCGRGASPGGTDYETYTASSSQEETFSESGADPAEVQKAQADFERFCDQLFRDQLSDSYLNLHYTLADPAAYGITDCPKELGEFSLDLLKEASETEKEEKALLDTIPMELLTEDQQLTYRILQASYEAEEEAVLSASGSYCRDPGPASGASGRVYFLWKTGCGGLSGHLVLHR